MDEALLGQILLVPYTFAPMDTVYCDGKEYPIIKYQALYSLLGNTFGGNVNTTFMPLRIIWERGIECF